MHCALRDLFIHLVELNNAQLNRRVMNAAIRRATLLLYGISKATFRGCGFSNRPNNNRLIKYCTSTT